MDFSKLRELQKQFPDNAQELNSMYKEYQSSDALSSLEAVEGIRKLLDLYKGYTEAINGKLLYQEKMTESERDLLLVERKCYSLMSETITAAKLNKKYIEEQI